MHLLRLSQPVSPVRADGGKRNAEKKSAAQARMPARREWAVGRRRTRFCGYPLAGLIDASPGCELSSADSGRGPDGVVKRVNSAARPACCGS